MTGISVEFIVNDKNLQSTLTALNTALTPAAIAVFLGGPVDEHMQERHQTRFASEGDEVTGPWAPLKPATQAIRESMGYGAAHPINVRTGDLEHHITDPGRTMVHPWGASLTFPGAPNTDSLEDKLRTAQQGDERTVPRPVLGLGTSDLMFVLTTLARYIEGRGTTIGVLTI